MTHTVTLVADHLGTTAPKVLGHEYYVDAIIDVTDLDDALTTTGNFVALTNTFTRTSGTAMTAFTVGQALAITNAADSGNNATVTVTTNRQNISTGTVTIVAKANVSTDGSRINMADGSVLIKKWDGIVPGASMTWEPVQTSLG